VGAYQWLARPREQEPASAAAHGPIIDPAALMASIKAHPTPAPATSETPTLFLHDGQHQTGPFTLTAVQAKLQRGEISRDASYWSEGLADWQSVADLAGQPIE
jgi:hypothetical protein